MAIRAGGATDRPTGGKRDILGLWIRNGGEGAKNWLQVLTEIENRGLRRGPTGTPWPATCGRCTRRSTRPTPKAAGRVPRDVGRAVSGYESLCEDPSAMMGQ